MFMIAGALAWSLQACNNSNQNDDGSMGSDSLYNNDNNNNPNINAPMNDGMGDTMGMDTLGTNGGMTTDTTGTNRPNNIP